MIMNKHFGNITLIGTSHIAKDSVDHVSNYILEHKPDIVCVELDKQRVASLFSDNSKQKSSLNLGLIRRVGLVGYLFMAIAGYIQKKLGRIVNIDPGADMKSAIVAAQKNNLKVALIDQHVMITLRKLSKELNFFAILRMIKDVFASAIFKKYPGVNVKFDLKKVPDDKTIEAMMDIMKDLYPEIYKVLIDERNKIMAKKLIVLSKKNPDKKIIAVIGAGHKKGMMEYLKKQYDKIEIPTQS